MNRLKNESSPYLRQHADNPVHWWPWCDEAFAEAKRRQVPVLLSVGYSTCHWCHVMAHESFEDEQTAALMNAGFVNIKVDREERPDVDAVYMAATQALTGQGGWPMTVFLTPEGRPFYAGTYFPPHEGMGLPSFARVLGRISTAWHTMPEQIAQNADALTEHLQDSTRMADTPADEDSLAQTLSNLSVKQAMQQLERLYDEQYGGFGEAPKFPAPTNLDFVLTQPEGRHMALHTLRALGKGGIYDQLGGGFHRYSVDDYWLVPHFEKMLYDNAQLLRPLLRAYQHTADPFFEHLVRQTLAYLQREMLSPEGGFYSAQDADTNGVEGLTFTWTPDEVRAVLADDAELALSTYGITEGGSFRDPHKPEYGSRSVLSLWGEPDEGLRARLLAARMQRPQPHTDQKVLTSWNGLALSALSDAARILDDSAFLALAEQNAAFVRARLRREDGTLYHSYLEGEAKVQGLLEDHALYGLGLVALFQASGQLSYLEWARELWHIVERDFWDEQAGVFMSTGGAAERLLVRQASAFDSAVLSDNAAAAQLGYWMQVYFAQEAHALTKIQRVLAAFARELRAAPSGFGGLWQVAHWLQQPLRELVIVGSAGERAPLEAVARRFDLHGVALAYVEEGTPLPAAEGRRAEEAYWCVGRTCRLPVREPEQLAALLEAELMADH